MDTYMDICFQLFIPLTGFHLWKCITWSIPDLTEDTEFWHRSVFLINSSTEPCWTYISGDPITQLRSRLFKPPRLSSRSSFSSLRLRLVGGGVFLSSWMERRSMLLYTCTKQKSPEKAYLPYLALFWSRGAIFPPNGRHSLAVWPWQRSWTK